MTPTSPNTTPDNPLGDPRRFRGLSTNLKNMAGGQKRSDFLPSFNRSVGSFAGELIKIILIAFAIIIPIRFFILQPFYVKGASMEPNFHDNEYLIIDELSYRLHQPHRGDVIVLRNPSQPSDFLIKRIIGLPSDRLTVNDGEVTIFDAAHPNGAVLDERDYLPPDRMTFGHLDVTLGTNEFYVMGDNRPASLDSRIFGPVQRSQIIGRTAVRAWPVYRFGTFRTPSIIYLPPSTATP
jgi:signal peptidase I